MQLQPIRVQLQSRISSRQQASLDIEKHRLTAHTMDIIGIQGEGVCYSIITKDD